MSSYKVARDIMYGQETRTGKKSWTKIGVVIEGPDGNQFLQINCLPLNWDGKASLFRPRNQAAEGVTREEVDETPF